MNKEVKKQHIVKNDTKHEIEVDKDFPMASEATLTISSSKKRRNRRDRRRLSESKMMRNSNSVDRPDTPTKLTPQVPVTPPLLNSPELQLR